MRKDSPMLKVAVILIMVLFLCMACLDKEEHQLVCILASALVGCVYMLCQSRVERAHAPLILRDECVFEKSKPPERDAE